MKITAKTIVLTICLLSFWQLADRHDCYSQTVLILRDLSKVETNSIRFDREQIVTAEGKSFGWDQVLTATLGTERKTEFEENVSRLGVPLFRVRHRLFANDWESLPPVAEPMFQQQILEQTTTANQRRHYLVCLAAFRGRTAVGDRTSALLAFIRLCKINEEFPETGSEFVSIGLPAADLNNQFTQALLPIWFDPASASKIVPNIKKTLGTDVGQYSDGSLIYLISLLAVSGNSHDTAIRYLKQLNDRNSILSKTWAPIVATQLELGSEIVGPATKQLRKTHKQLDGPIRAVANYLLARQMGDNQDEFDSAVLDLLSVATNFAQQYPELSAAALYEAASISEKAGRNQEAKIIRSELLKSFKNTYHGSLKIND